jgi:hypothetical protein
MPDRPEVDEQYSAGATRAYWNKVARTDARSERVLAARLARATAAAKLRGLNAWYANNPQAEPPNVSATKIKSGTQKVAGGIAAIRKSMAAPDTATATPTPTAPTAPPTPVPTINSRTGKPMPKTLTMASGRVISTAPTIKPEEIKSIQGQADRLSYAKKWNETENFSGQKLPQPATRPIPQASAQAQDKINSGANLPPPMLRPMPTSWVKPAIPAASTPVVPKPAPQVAPPAPTPAAPIAPAKPEPPTTLPPTLGYMATESPAAKEVQKMGGTIAGMAGAMKRAIEAPAERLGAGWTNSMNQLKTEDEARVKAVAAQEAAKPKPPRPASPWNKSVQ